MKRKTIFVHFPLMLAVLTLALTSCYSFGAIYIRNKTMGKVKVRFYVAKNTSLAKSLQYYDKNKAIQYFVADGQDSILVHEVRLPGRRGGSNVNCMLLERNFTWSDKNIDEYTSSIRKIEIISPKDTVTVEGQKTLVEYFKKHREWTVIGNTDEIAITIAE
ncbi:MAG: hypothetical protein LBK18_01620 [Prevotellaceae bacterium]|jgi:hypothetical protein|nr:hypothetical protein [Prevotellaceae bacterium]